MLSADPPAARLDGLVARADALAGAAGELAAAAAEVRDELRAGAARAVAPSLLTIDEAATALAVGRSTVMDLIGSGALASIKIGRLRRVPVGAVDAYITAAAATAGAGVAS